MSQDTSKPDDQTSEFGESTPPGDGCRYVGPASDAAAMSFGGGRGHGRGNGHCGGSGPAHGHGHGPGYGRCPGHCIGDLQPGQRGCVVGYRPCHRGYKRKLLQMGLVRGAEFLLLRKAPLGDPVEIEVGGFHLTLRRHEANALVVDAV